MQCRSERGILRDVRDCVFILKLLVEQCRNAEPIAVDQALLHNFSYGLLWFRSIFSVAISANVAVLTAVWNYPQFLFGAWFAELEVNGLPALDSSCDLDDNVVWRFILQC